MDFISVKDCRKHIESGAVFSFKCVTYDKKRKKGGEIMDYWEAQMMKKPKDLDAKQDLGRSLTAEESMKLKKRQNHWDNYTYNLVILQDGKPTNVYRKIHPPLLLEFNGLTVVS